MKKQASCLFIYMESWTTFLARAEPIFNASAETFMSSLTEAPNTGNACADTQGRTALSAGSASMSRRTLQVLGGHAYSHSAASTSSTA